MTINGISGGNTQTGRLGMNQATASYSRNVQKSYPCGCQTLIRYHRSEVKKIEHCNLR